MRILFLGDIVGRPGRRVVEKVLPELIQQKKPDIVLANVENLAGGKGITKKTLQEMRKAGIDFFTGGNHIFKNPEGAELLEDESTPVVVPANFAPEAPGIRWALVSSDKGTLLVLSLLGQTFMPQQVDSPFRCLDELLEVVPEELYDAVFVDFHAEATSEKQALRWHADGRISALVGTHTHVPTADADVSPKGTAFLSDAGMNGSLDSCIGVKKERIIRKLMTQLPVSHELETRGRMQFNAVCIDILKNGRAKRLQTIRKVLPA